MKNMSTPTTNHDSQTILLRMLEDGRPHLRQTLTTAVAASLDKPYHTFEADLQALRQDGWRIAYSRRKSVAGYYLQQPPRVEQLSRWSEPLNRQHIALIQALSPAEKVARAMASAEFILTQRRLLLAEAHPDWSEKQIDEEARRIVYRVSPQDFDTHELSV